MIIYNQVHESNPLTEAVCSLLSDLTELHKFICSYWLCLGCTHAQSYYVASENVILNLSDTRSTYRFSILNYVHTIIT